LHEAIHKGADGKPGESSLDLFGFLHLSLAQITDDSLQEET